MNKKEQVETLQKALFSLGEIEYKAKHSAQLAEVIKQLLDIGKALLDESKEPPSAPLES